MTISWLGLKRMKNGQDTGANRIHQSSMEAGERWIVNDVTGQPIRTWDSRGHDFTFKYDELRRLTEKYVHGEDSARPDQRTREKSILFEKFEYGENQTSDTDCNLRTRVYKQYDGAGIVINQGTNPNSGKGESYDFKGNLLRSRRLIAKPEWEKLDQKSYLKIPDWTNEIFEPPLDTETFKSATRYDALNRPGTVYRATQRHRAR